jgi:hypothetical protein
LDAGQAKLVGFEPNLDALKRLNEKKAGTSFIFPTLYLMDQSKS